MDLLTIDSEISTQDPILRTAIYRAFKRKCFWTGQFVKKEDMHVDHVVPFSKGGPNCIRNYVLTSKFINLNKSDRLDPDKVGAILYLNETTFAPKVLRIVNRKLMAQNDCILEVKEEIIQRVRKAESLVTDQTDEDLMFRVRLEEVKRLKSKFENGVRTLSTLFPNEILALKKSNNGSDEFPKPWMVRNKKIANKFRRNMYLIPILNYTFSINEKVKFDIIEKMRDLIIPIDNYGQKDWYEHNEYPTSILKLDHKFYDGLLSKIDCTKRLAQCTIASLLSSDGPLINKKQYGIRVISDGYFRPSGKLWRKSSYITEANHRKFFEEFSAC